MASLYANENFPAPVVAELRNFGHDLLTVQETGKAEQRWPDAEVLAFAISQGRAGLTLNRRHFFQLHATQPAHAGIIACTFDPDFIRQAKRIDDAIVRHGELKGALLRVYRS